MNPFPFYSSTSYSPPPPTPLTLLQPLNLPPPKPYTSPIQQFLPPNPAAPPDTLFDMKSIALVDLHSQSSTLKESWKERKEGGGRRVYEMTTAPPPYFLK